VQHGGRGREGGERGNTRRIALYYIREGILFERQQQLDIHFFITLDRTDKLLYSYYTPNSTSPTTLTSYSKLNGNRKTHQGRPAPPQGPLQACRSVRSFSTRFIVLLTPVQMKPAASSRASCTHSARQSISSCGIA